MKKRKLLLSLGSVAALTAPMASVLFTTTSCGGQKYAELVSEMKDDCIQTFMSICRNTHRNLWNEGEGYNYVVKQMTSMGHKIAGRDRWSELTAVKNMASTEISDIEKNQEWSGQKYGNVWYDIDPTPGCEKLPKVILQCHLDSQMDFVDDELHQQKAYQQWAKPAEEGGCISIDFNQTDELMSSAQNQTSLGADGGVGMAILLTIAKYQNRFAHPGIRLLFTAGESEAVPKQKIDGKEYPDYASGFSLLYYDQIRDRTDTKEEFDFWEGERPFGEKEGEFKYIASVSGVIKNSIFVSSSGIHECSIHTPDYLELSKFNNLNNLIASVKSGDPKYDNMGGNVIDWEETTELPWKTEPATKKHVKITIPDDTLQGGTSSTYINKKQGSAIAILYKTLFSGDTNIQLINCYSYPDNAYTISTGASVEFASFYDATTWRVKWESLVPTLKYLYPNEDWAKIQRSIKFEDDLPTDKTTHAMSKRQSRDFIRMLAKELHFGPINWFNNGDVKTSCNYGPCILNIHEPDESQDNASFGINFHIVERSSSNLQLQIFKEQIHSIFNDGFINWFGPEATEYWQDALVTHIEDPVWENPEEAGIENKLAGAFQKAYNSFKIRNKVANEHAWLEIACAGDIYSRLPTSWEQPNCIMIGPQVEQNHTANEVLYTDTISTVIQAVVYVLDNMGSLLPN